jgi:hypothetical protein
LVKAVQQGSRKSQRISPCRNEEEGRCCRSHFYLVLPPKTPVKVKGLDAFFKDVTKDEKWHAEPEKAEVERFRQLVGTLKDSLADIKVFQVGKPESDVYIIGRTESGWAGLKTRVVET